jgi:hypothetical protein
MLTWVDPHAARPFTVLALAVATACAGQSVVAQSPASSGRVVPGLAYTIHAIAGAGSGSGMMGAVGVGGQNYTGRAVVVGDRGRMDITDGGVESLFSKGDYILFDTTDLVIVHPATKDFVVLRHDAASQGLAHLESMGLKMTVSDLKVTLDSIGAGDTVAGIPTRHYRMTTAFNLSIDAGFMQQGLGTESVTDYWVANVPGLPANPLLRVNGISSPGAAMTGLFADLSNKVDSAARRLGSAVALKTVTVSRMNQGPGTSTTTRQESSVSDIRHQDVDESLLVLPEGYKPGALPGMEQSQTADDGAKWRTLPRSGSRG